MKRVHFSRLKKFALSAAHYRHSVDNEIETTRAMRLGTLVDMLLLTDKTPIVSSLNRNSLDYKSLRKRTPEEIDIFSTAEHEEGLAMVAAAEAHPIARDFLGLDDPDRRTQIPLEWTSMGIPRGTRGLDVVTKKRLVDLKCTQTTNPGPFGWHARRMFWHAQLADYVEACAQNEIDISGGVYLLGIESSAPYPITALRMTEGALLEGSKLVRKWLEAYRSCDLAGVWPDYTQSPVDLEIYDSETIVVGADPDDDAS